ncbi:hypothetical protein EFW58_04356 [Bacillus velezensis]|nr:hypothetical protein EFW58_04356 [Bacillus velezensis]
MNKDRLNRYTGYKEGKFFRPSEPSHFAIDGQKSMNYDSKE